MPTPLLPETNVRTTPTTVSLLPVHRAALADTAKSLGVSWSEVMRRAIEEFARNNT